MKVISVNVGLPRVVEYMGEPVATGIFKSAAEGKVAVGPLNLEGDRQADLRVHGGPMKSVYVYPVEHYSYWHDELPAGTDLTMGAFGENFTTEGIFESEVRRGDRLRIGTAEFEVTVPRFPCYKLGIRFGRRDMLRRFMKSGRSGFYLSVLKTGELEPGEEIKFEKSGSGKTISEVFADRM
jgi:MOSC domain-containing protein YiiM